MRYGQGGGLTAERREFRERLRLEAAERFARGERNALIAEELRVGVRSVQRWRRAWAENSHQPTRQRERAMEHFRSLGAAQRFLSAFSGLSPHFRPRRHLLTAPQHRFEMTLRFTLWDHVTGSTGLPTKP